MRRSDGTNARIDWRGWLVLAWALAFGARYAMMVVEQRGGKIGAMIGRAALRPPGPVLTEKARTIGG